MTASRLLGKLVYATWLRFFYEVNDSQFGLV